MQQKVLCLIILAHYLEKKRFKVLPVTPHSHGQPRRPRSLAVYFQLDFYLSPGQRGSSDALGLFEQVWIEAFRWHWSWTLGAWHPLEQCGPPSQSDPVGQESEPARGPDRGCPEANLHYSERSQFVVGSHPSLLQWIVVYWVLPASWNQSNVVHCP